MIVNFQSSGSGELLEDFLQVGNLVFAGMMRSVSSAYCNIG
jgi:hypothetical protein